VSRGQAPFRPWLEARSRDQLIRWTGGSTPTVLANAVAMVSELFSGEAVRVDPSLDLVSFSHEIVSIWRTEESLGTIERKKRPWILWAVLETSDPELLELSQSLTFMQGCYAVVGQDRRTHGWRAFISAWIRNYNPNHPLYFRYGEWIENVISGKMEARFSTWKGRSERYQIFAEEGPEILARCVKLKMTDNGTSIDGVLKDAGLVGDLGASPIVRFSLKAVLSRLADLFNECPADVIPINDILEAFLNQEGKLQFRDLRLSLQVALTRPFRETQPPVQLRISLLEWMVKCFGDPRVHAQAWVGADEAAGIVRSWQVLDSFRLFFDILDNMALDRHWSERKTFWQRYLQGPWVTEARVLLGPQAVRRVPRDIDRSTYATLTGEIQGNHSVLMMTIKGPIGTIVVIEWSHMGSFRAWMQNDLIAPKPYEPSYSRRQLMMQPKFRQVHSGGWQGMIDQAIKTMTGVDLRGPSTGQRDTEMRIIGSRSPDGSGQRTLTSGDQTSISSRNPNASSVVAKSPEARYYHRRTCERLTRKRYKNLVEFTNNRAAGLRGFSPCQACRPHLD